MPGIAVDDDRDAHSSASTSSVVGSGVCAPKRDAAIAPAAQARRSDSSDERPSSVDTTKQAVKASPAPVPSTASTRGAATRTTSTPSSNRTAPSGPSVTTTTPSRCGSASSSKRLTMVTSAAGNGPRAGAAFRKKRSAASSAARSTVSSGISSWQRTASVSSMSRSSGISSRFAPGATTISFSPSASTVMSATPVGPSTRFSRSSLTPARSSSASASAASSSFPTHAISSTSAPRRAAATAWFAPLPPGMRLNVAPVTVSPGRGRRSARATRSTLIDPTTVRRTAGTWENLGDGQDAEVVERAAEQVLAQVEEARPENGAVGDELDARRVGEPFERAHEHGQLEVRLRDALRRNAHTGPVEDRLPVEQLRRARPSVPRPPFHRVGLQLEQVAIERPLQARERSLDAVGGTAQRRLPSAGRRRLRLPARPLLEQPAERERGRFAGAELC